MIGALTARLGTVPVEGGIVIAFVGISPVPGCRVELKIA